MPSNYKRKIQDILDRSRSASDFLDHCTELFSSNNQAFKDFLSEYLLNKLRIYIREQNGTDSQLDAHLKLIKYFPKGSDTDYFALQEYLDVFLPRARHSIWKDLVVILSLIIPAVLLLYFILQDLNVLILTVHFFWLGVLGPILLFLFFLVYIISPNLIRQTKFPGNLTIQEFIEQTVEMNDIFYRIDDFEKTRIILKEVYYARHNRSEMKFK